jgi:hypothetical protein
VHAHGLYHRPFSPDDLPRCEPKAIGAVMSTDDPGDGDPGNIRTAYFAATFFLRLRLASTLKNSTAAEKVMAK